MRVRKTTALIFPKGTYRRQTYYFRGGDTFQEPEYHEAESRALKIEMNNLQKEIGEIQEEYKLVEQEFESVAEVVSVIATSKGKGSEKTLEHQNLIQKTSDLKAQIKMIESEIKLMQSNSSPLNISLLGKEDSLLFSEIKYLNTEGANKRDLSQQQRKSIVETTISDSFLSNLQTAIEVNSKTRLLPYFKKIVSAQRDEHILGAHSKSLTIQNDFGVLYQLEEQTEFYLQKFDVHLMKAVAQIHQKVIIEMFIRYAEELNFLIEERNGNPVDLDDFVSRFQPNRTQKSTSSNQANLFAFDDSHSSVKETPSEIQ